MDGEVARPAAAVPVSTPRPHGKRQLARCHIEAHTIQRAASPKKKKALDPLRYIPERAAFFALFTVAVELEDAGVGEAPRRVFRTYKQFRALHSRMLKMYPRSNLPRDLPSMRKKRYDNDYIEQKRQELNAYLAEILRVPEVRTSKLLREFLEDTHLSDDSEDDDGNSTSSKILEGLPGTIVTVRAGQSFSLSLTLANIGDTASWQFTTKKHNIGFSVTFNGQIVKPYAREESTVKAIKGFYRCTTPGICTLDWDNTYTWSKAKVLVYWAEVEKAVQAPAAPASAPAALGGSASVPPLLTQGLTPAPPSPLSSSDASDRSRSFPSIDSAAGLGGEGDGDRRRSGYIAQTRNRSMYPRRIVNSSISLITKPFVSGLARSTSTSEEHVKAGSLIVERSVKFRGRNWYRKWFVLDTRKCMLRYFESEVAAQRGLSQSKLNLNNKHASLAITSSMALDSAPTPYMFIVRTRKRCWKICAPSHAEYTAWEHAISTAIFAAQLSREARAEKKRKRKKGKSGDYREAGDGGRGSGGSTALATGDRLSIDDDDEEEDDDDDSSKNDDDNESEESDDEDAEAATGGGERDDTDEEELPCSSDTNPVISRSVIPAVSELYEAPTPAVPTTVNVERQGMTLRQLPAQWKLVALVSVNGVCLTMRWMPALFVVVILVAVDWYLMLRFMKKSWHENALHEHFNKLD